MSIALFIVVWYCYRIEFYDDITVTSLAIWYCCSFKICVITWTIIQSGAILDFLFCLRSKYLLTILPNYSFVHNNQSSIWIRESRLFSPQIQMLSKVIYNIMDKTYSYNTTYSYNIFLLFSLRRGATGHLVPLIKATSVGYTPLVAKTQCHYLAHLY
jgi:hypothetical protein